MTKSCIIDTNVLLNNIDLKEYDKIFCPITVLEEVDKLKESNNQEKAFKARSAIRYIQSIQSKIKYTFIRNNVINNEKYDLSGGLDINKPDNMIVAHANFVQKMIDENAIMITFDLNMIQKCKSLGINVKDINEYDSKEIYKGYEIVRLETDEKLSYFYEHLNENIYNLSVNEYLIIEDKSGDMVDALKWNGTQYVDLKYKQIRTDYIESTFPKDEIQRCAFDSMFTNDVTCLFGKSGTGKTLLVLGYALHELRSGNVNKIHILTTCKDLRDSQSIGFLPGTKDEKLLNDNIGLILTTKFGGIDPILSLMDSGKLEITPLSKIRGTEFSKDDIVIATESQNINVYQMKTILQRCKSGCKILIEGDMLEQKDVINKESLGMERLIEVFKGSKYFGCVKLKNNYRNPIGELADKM